MSALLNEQSFRDLRHLETSKKTPVATPPEKLFCETNYGLNFDATRIQGEASPSESFSTQLLEKIDGQISEISDVTEVVRLTEKLRGQ